MAVNSKGLTALEVVDVIGQVVQIQTGRIRRFVNQPRKHFNREKLERLAISIKRVGQKKPIKVMPVVGDPNHDYELVDGERRWIACGIAGVDVLAWVVSARNEEEQFLESVVDNMVSEPHTDLEYAYAVDRIMKSEQMKPFGIGEVVKIIAEAFGVSESTIERYRALLRLDPEVQAMMSMEVGEEDRLNTSIAHFISGLHPDLQREIAARVVEKKMTLNQARLFARQLAEKTGQVVGGEGFHEPRRDFRMMVTFTRRMRNDLGTFLTPTVITSLRRRGQKDMQYIAAELDFCIRELMKLKEVVSAPYGVVGTPSPLPPTSPLPPPAPKPNPDGKARPDEETFKLYSAIFLILFYSGNRTEVKVNLSRGALARAFPKVADIDWAVKEAIKLSAEYFRKPPASSGSPEEQKFSRMVNRFRHDFGNFGKIDGCFKRAMEQDKSKDPVSL